MPGSSSLIHTAAVMCIAETSTMPSAIPELLDGRLHVVGDAHELAALGGVEGPVDGVGGHGPA